jgi:hypothetical protein
MTAMSDVKAASAAQVAALTAIVDAVTTLSGDTPTVRLKAASAAIKASEVVLQALPNS